MAELEGTCIHFKHPGLQGTYWLDLSDMTWGGGTNFDFLTLPPEIDWLLQRPRAGKKNPYEVLWLAHDAEYLRQKCIAYTAL